MFNAKSKIAFVNNAIERLIANVGTVIFIL